MNPKNSPSYAIFLPCVEERASLLTTIKIIQSENKESHHFYIVSNTAENCDQIRLFLDTHTIPARAYTCIQQREHYLSGALKEALLFCQEDYFILMASDLETDPTLVKNLIKTSQQHPEKIITVTRWDKSATFKNYGILKMFANFSFQTLGRLIYKTNLTDLTFGFRLYPTQIIKSIEFTQTGHAILLEALLSPLSEGVRIKEIIGSWKRRREGLSKKDWQNNFVYLHLLLSGSKVYRCFARLLFRLR